jgi:hypothetical protein
MVGTTKKGEKIVAQTGWICPIQGALFEKASGHEGDRKDAEEIRRAQRTGVLDGLAGSELCTTRFGKCFRDYRGNK